jgi:hypothetical protein
LSIVNINGSILGTPLQNLLMCDSIEPGAAPSYEVCKILYEFHPLGGKMAEAPIAMAQSQMREIAIPGGPEDRLKEAFQAEWQALKADKQIFNVVRLSRVYGIASIVLMPEDGDPSEPVEFETLYKAAMLKFNVFDPLNTAGSLVLNQNPNDPDFLKTPGGIRVGGMSYHPSRTVVKLNEEPIYLGYTSSAFGYVGRSVYQRALFPLRSFVQSMRTDDLVVFKIGVLVAKIKQAGSIVSNAMMRMFNVKRNVLKEAQTGNVISIDPDEGIETLNMQNLEGAYGMVRTNILKNIATAADMPARLLENETMVSGFGEGTEDAKAIAQYIDRCRIDMAPIYEFFDQIVQYRAWNPEFYAALQTDFPDYKSVPYKTAFYDWRNAFTAQWPSMLKEPDSELAKADDVRLKAIIALVEVFLPALDPINKVIVLQWAQDNFNELKLLFPTPLLLDAEALEDYEPPAPLQEPSEPKPFAAADSAISKLRQLARA